MITSIIFYNADRSDSKNAITDGDNGTGIDIKEAKDRLAVLTCSNTVNTCVNIKHRKISYEDRVGKMRCHRL